MSMLSYSQANPCSPMSQLRLGEYDTTWAVTFDPDAEIGDDVTTMLSPLRSSGLCSSGIAGISNDHPKRSADSVKAVGSERSSCRSAKTSHASVRRVVAASTTAAKVACARLLFIAASASL